MQVREAMTPDPVVVWPSTSVLYARRLLERHGIRHLPVVTGAKVVGMVSARDLQIADRLIDRYRSVDTIMSKPVVAVGSAVGLRDAARIMARRRIGALPVIDGDRLVGIVTTTDCLLAISEDRVGVGRR